MKKMGESAQNPQDKYKFDFKNVFELIFIFPSTTKSDSVINDTIRSDYNTMPIELRVFMQENLID